MVRYRRKCKIIYAVIIAMLLIGILTSCNIDDPFEKQNEIHEIREEEQDEGKEALQEDIGEPGFHTTSERQYSICVIRRA